MPRRLEGKEKKGKDRTGKERTGQDRTGQDRKGKETPFNVNSLRSQVLYWAAQAKL